MKKRKPVEPKKWQDFRETGLLWWVNRTLHLFGWAIVVEINTETKDIVKAYPARTVFRGFREKDEGEGFTQLTEYLRSVIDTLRDECYLEEDNEQKKDKS